jgi:hypothetical protein
LPEFLSATTLRWIGRPPPEAASAAAAAAAAVSAMITPMSFIAVSLYPSILHCPSRYTETVLNSKNDHFLLSDEGRQKGFCYSLFGAVNN